VKIYTHQNTQVARSAPALRLVNNTSSVVAMELLGVLAAEVDVVERLPMASFFGRDCCRSSWNTR
jgi:hypothetical protein